MEHKRFAAIDKNATTIITPVKLSVGKLGLYYTLPFRVLNNQSGSASIERNYRLQLYIIIIIDDKLSLKIAF